jgi:YfiH family protein
VTPVLKSDLLSDVAGVRHAFFTRQGGVSKGIYESLNLGVGSRDKIDAVDDNRARAAMVFGVDLGKLLTCYQVHSSIAVTVTEAWSERPEADAIVTRTPGLVCGALSADCAAVLIVDPEARVVASAHAGWKGALGGVVEAAVEAMRREGAEPSRCLAAVGPCIGPDSYEVSEDFRERFRTEDPGSEQYFKPAESAGKHMFDLPAFVLQRIERAGVGRAEWIGGDTCADEARFFSNRRATLRGEPDYGRLMSAIMLER